MMILDYTENDYAKIELPEKLLTALAKALAPEIRNFYNSEEGQAYFEKRCPVLSARENITDDASGILIEGVLESMAEYYSVELTQKIHRGMAINAEKCLSNGSNPGLGFKMDKKERTFYVDEDEAAIVAKSSSDMPTARQKQRSFGICSEEKSKPPWEMISPTTV